MSIQMIMKRPVKFPDLDPEKILLGKTPKCVSEALQTYGEALLDCNDPCMEASESAFEVVTKLKSSRCAISIKLCGEDRFLLSDGQVQLILESHEDSSIYLVFTPFSKGIDVSDFGPGDVARFIKAVFKSYGKVSQCRLLAGC